MAERMAKVQPRSAIAWAATCSCFPSRSIRHGYAGQAECLREAPRREPGWQFLTGEKQNVDLVLKKLGQYVESRDAHSNLIIVGNEPTGLWKKAFGLAAPKKSCASSTAWPTTAAELRPMQATPQLLRATGLLAMLGTALAGATPPTPRSREVSRFFARDYMPTESAGGRHRRAGRAAARGLVACINCHGHDARGKTDGGVTTSDIRWDTLAKPYELTLPGGRRRGPYDATLFFAALTRGMDSSGRALDPAMPRYRLSATEASDVVAYLQQVGRPVDEGVTDAIVRIGFSVPADAALAATAEQDRSLLVAWLERVNRQGGVFRRRLELVAVGPPVSVGVLAVSPARQTTARWPPIRRSEFPRCEQSPAQAERGGVMSLRSIRESPNARVHWCATSSPTVLPPVQQSRCFTIPGIPRRPSSTP